MRRGGPAHWRGARRGTMVAAHVGKGHAIAAAMAAGVTGSAIGIRMFAAMLPVAVTLMMAAMHVVAAVVAVIVEMVAMGAPHVVAAVIVAAVPSVAAPVRDGVAHRFLIAGVAIPKPTGISSAHAPLVELDAIVVTPAAAGTIGPRRVVIGVGAGDALVFMIGPTIGIGGADKDEPRKGGEDQRLLHLTLSDDAERRSFTIVNDCC